MTYSRDNPSPRFRELLGFYAQMHSEGDLSIDTPAEKMFDGRSLTPHVYRIRDLLKKFRARTLLDYGAGKAKHYERTVFTLPDGQRLTGLRKLWKLRQLRLYDPGYAPLAEYPSGVFDAVVCTDVLEHIPEEDLDWVIGDLFGFTRLMLYAGVAVYPATKILPDGTNAHVTVKPAEWWLEKFIKCRATVNPQTEFVLVVERGHNDNNPQVLATFRHS